jgi:hypothetical protein
LIEGLGMVFTSVLLWRVNARSYGE